MISFLFDFNDAGIDLMYGLHVTVAAFYNYMFREFVKGDGIFSNDLINNVMDYMYYIVGIFMLFRIGVSLLQYMINPDKATDKNVGGSKLVTHIIISIVLFLTMNTFIFPLTGKLQDYLLGKTELETTDADGNKTTEVIYKDGILDTFFNRIAGTGEISKNEDFFQEIGKTSMNNSVNKFGLIKNVNATDNELDCYYAYFFYHPTDKTKKAYTFLKVKYFNGETSSDGTISQHTIGDGWKIAINTESFKETANINGNKFEFSSSYQQNYLNVRYWGDNEEEIKSGLSNGTCPNNIYYYACDMSGTHFYSTGYWPSANPEGPSMCQSWSKGLKAISRVDNDNSDDKRKNAIGYLALGTNVEDGFDKFINKVMAESPQSFTSENGKTTLNLENNLVRNEETKDSNYNTTLDYVKQTSAAKLATEALENGTMQESAGATFAGTLFLSMVSQANSDGKAVIDGLTNKTVLVDKNALETIKNAHPDKINVYWFLGIIMAIITLGLIAILCIDIIVRNCKILLLQILSPIAVLSYMNPNDKILGQWSKQYIASFIDLFLKLIAMYMISILLQILIKDTKGLGNVFVILGILTFAKMVPDFISKIFGIKDAAGSFKESAKMLKTAAFTAGGAGIGLGAAGLTGVGAFRATKGQGGWARFGSVAQSFGTALSSTIRGASGGAKGNILAGQKHASATNARRRELYESGVGVGSAMLAGATLGLYNPNHKDEQIEQAYDDLLSKRKDLDSRVEGEINKGKDNYRMTEDSINKSLLGKNYEAAKNAGYLGLSSQQLKEKIDNASPQEKPVLEDAYYAAKAKETVKGMKMQDFNNYRNSDEFKNLSGVEASKYDKLYADEMNEAKSQYVQDVKANRKEDSQAVAYMDTYDRAVEAYSKKYGKKDAKDKDTNYAYDFTSLTTTDQVHDGDSYKATKSQAEDARIKFSNSATRANHYKQEKANK